MCSQPTSLLGKIDYYIFDLFHSIRDFKLTRHSEKQRDCALRIANAHTWICYYGLRIPQAISQFAVLRNLLPGSRSLTILDNSRFIFGVSALGLITSAITAAQEGIGILRHRRFLKNLEGRAILPKISKPKLESRVRPWVMAKINDAKLEERELVDLVRGVVQKKIVVHTIGLIAMLFSIAGLIAALLTFPISVPFIFVGIGIFLWGIRFIALYGWADNPEGRLSLRLCLPFWLE